jgi:hypothetical protein
MNFFNHKTIKTLIAIYGKSKELNPGLARLFKGGFVLKDGCLFWEKMLYRQSHIDLNDHQFFIDNTARENFINSIFIDDFIKEKKDYFYMSLLFVNRVIREWEKVKHDFENDLEIIMSIRVTGIQVSFHLLRENETLINLKEIDEFEESLIILHLDN